MNKKRLIVAASLAIPASWLFYFYTPIKTLLWLNAAALSLEFGTAKLFLPFAAAGFAALWIAFAVCIYRTIGLVRKRRGTKWPFRTSTRP